MPSPSLERQPWLLSKDGEGIPNVVSPEPVRHNNNNKLFAGIPMDTHSQLSHHSCVMYVISGGISLDQDKHASAHASKRFRNS